MEEQVPLIWTKNGNVPIASLGYEESWQITDEIIILTEVWRDETGELVKNNVHIYAKKGLPSLGSEQGQLR